MIVAVPCCFILSHENERKIIIINGSIINKKHNYTIKPRKCSLYFR